LLGAIREWWDGGEPILVLLEALSEGEGDSPHKPTLPKLARNPVALDRSNRMARVGDGPAIALSDAEVIISRRQLKPASWLETPIGRASEKWIYEVYIRHGTEKTLVAEYGSRAGAERGARNLREDLVLPTL
jgi:hypothetical protein